MGPPFAWRDAEVARMCFLETLRSNKISERARWECWHGNTSQNVHMLAALAGPSPECNTGNAKRTQNVNSGNIGKAKPARPIVSKRTRGLQRASVAFHALDVQGLRQRPRLCAEGCMAGLPNSGGRGLPKGARAHPRLPGWGLPPSGVGAYPKPTLDLG